jgi:hypothetical protein
LVAELARLGADTRRIEIHDHGTDLAERAAHEDNVGLEEFVYLDMVDIDCVLDPRHGVKRPLAPVPSWP